MSLTVSLMNNTSPVERIGKDLEAGPTFDCLFKSGTSILRPTIVIKSSDNLAMYNYMYISDMSRYYFIDDVVSLHNDIWEISGHVDVLETYKGDILGNEAILENTQVLNANKYLQDNDVFVTNCKHKTDIVQFPSGLLDTGEFILITAGG